MHLRCSLKRPCDFHSSFFSPFPIAFPTFIFLIWWLDKFARFIKKKKREREGELRIKLKFFFLTLRALLLFFFLFLFSSLSHCFKSCFFFFCCSCCFGLTFSVFFCLHCSRFSCCYPPSLLLRTHALLAPVQQCRKREIKGRRGKEREE